MRSTFTRTMALFFSGLFIVALTPIHAKTTEKSLRKNRLSDYFEPSIDQSMLSKSEAPKVLAQNNIKPEVFALGQSANETRTENKSYFDTQENANSSSRQSMSDSSFDTEFKNKEVIDLVEKGIQYLQTHKPHDAFQAFTRDKNFKKGELYLFVFDTNGVCLAHGQETDLLWNNLYNLKGSYGSLVIQDIINKANSGGGWFTYRWRNATQNAYVKQVSVNEKTYIIAAGYYPHSKVDAVVNLVKAAVSLFNETIKAGRSKDEVLSALSYPLGKFIFGDLYIYALDFNGVQIAHGDLPGIIGTNEWNYTDSNGKFVNQEIVAKLKEAGSGGIWIDYMSKNALKKAYAEKVVDEKGKEYFIACGYYPEANIDRVYDLVRRGYEFMKKSGVSISVQDFSNPFSKDFRYGDLYLFVYDKKGRVIANGKNPSLIGQNHFNLKDEDGTFYIQELIKKAERGGGSIEAKTKGSFQSFYVEQVDLGVENYIIGSSVYPISKEETMLFMAKSGASFLRSNEPEEAFKEFTQKDGKFIRGDMSVFVLDGQGTCFASGDDYNLIWRNLINEKDDNGKLYIQMFINTAKNGAAQVSYNLGGKTWKAHLEPVIKNGTFYVVGSKFCV